MRLEEERKTRVGFEGGEKATEEMTESVIKNKIKNEVVRRKGSWIGMDIEREKERESFGQFKPRRQTDGHFPVIDGIRFLSSPSLLFFFFPPFFQQSHLFSFYLLLLQSIVLTKKKKGSTQII